MMKKQKIILITLTLFWCFTTKSQNIGVGASAIYNFQTESFGAGVRASFFPDNNFSISPQFSYYFAFNKINEYNIGFALEYKFFRTDYLNFYGIFHGAYNRWINYAASSMNDAKLNNLNFEGGIGISTNHCLRPFLEYRYNVKFLETHLQFGLLYIFGCRSYYVDKNSQCPAY